MIGRKGIHPVTSTFIVLMIIFTIIFGVLPIIFQSASGEIPAFATAYDLIADLAGVDLVWPSVFYYFIMPYIASTFIIFGLMEEIGIFRRMGSQRHIFYAVISIAWAATLIPTGFLSFIALYLYQAGAIAAIVIFFIAFLGGSLFWSLAFYKTSKGAKSVIDQLQREREEILIKIQDATEDFKNDNDETKFQKRMTSYNMRLSQIDKQMSKLSHFGATPRKRIKT